MNSFSHLEFLFHLISIPAPLHFTAKFSANQTVKTYPLGENEKEMWSDDADPNEEWKKWKLVPARIPDEEIEELEKEIGTRLPLSLKAFLTVTHHCFVVPWEQV